MGNRRKPRRSRTSAQIAALANALGDQRIEGGCEDCNAYQTMHRNPDHPGVTHLNVHHDDTCPFLTKYEGRRS